MEGRIWDGIVDVGRMLTWGGVVVLMATTALGCWRAENVIDVDVDEDDGCALVCGAFTSEMDT